MFTPPPPPQPPLNQDGLFLSKQILAKDSINTKKEVNDTNINSLLSQIRQGAKLKKVSQINDRSNPIITGLNNTNKEPSPITPSMFKGGSGPLNLNFKSPQFGNNLVNQKSNQISKSNNNSTLNQNILNNSNKQSFNTVHAKSSSKPMSERPNTKPPPLPYKPPGINRRQSFESGQISNLKKFSTIIVNDSNSSTKTTFSTNKPAPPPRNANVSFSYATLKPTSSITNTNTSTLLHKSTQNLNSIGISSYTNSTTVSNSTLKPKGNSTAPMSLKTYPTTPRPSYLPPPPPLNKPPGSINGSSNIGNIQNRLTNINSDSNSSLNKSNFGLHSYNSTSSLQTPLSFAPPPLPTSIVPPSSIAPPPPSQIRKDFTSAQNLNSNNLNNKTVPITSITKNTSKAIDLESRFCHSFKNIKDLPPPEPLTKIKKQYPSTRSNPAPKPPQYQASNLSQFNNTSTPLMNF